MKPRLLFYCQHVLGMGHFTRSVEIVKGLSAFDVSFLNGGDPINGFALPAGVEFVDLPPIRSDTEFSQIEARDARMSLEAVQEARRARILAACERIRPHIAVIELFPFGRRLFAFELLPMLERLRAMGARIVCSLRDIVVAHRHDREQNEENTCRWLNQHFDLLLIHSDPRFQKLEETFPKVGQLTCDIQYTGFVVQPPPPCREPANGKPRIVVSLGGGRFGWELLECAIDASPALRRPHEMLAFAGPLMPEEQWARTQLLAAKSPNVTLERYSKEFLAYLSAADLSVSLAGYNTCMNILATRVRALVYPETCVGDQTIRARKLERLGAVSVLEPWELTPPRLAERIDAMLAAPPPGAMALDTNGVARTAELLGAAVAGVAS